MKLQFNVSDCPDRFKIICPNWHEWWARLITLQNKSDKQESFWARGQPMRDNFTMWRNYSIARIHMLYIRLTSSGCQGVSNHWQIDCLSNGLFRSTSKKTSKIVFLVLCDGNPPVRGGFHSQRVSNAKNIFSVMTSPWSNMLKIIYRPHNCEWTTYLCSNRFKVCWRLGPSIGGHLEVFCLVFGVEYQLQISEAYYLCWWVETYWFWAISDSKRLLGDYFGLLWFPDS